MVASNQQIEGTGPRVTDIFFIKPHQNFNAKFTRYNFLAPIHIAKNLFSKAPPLNKTRGLKVDPRNQKKLKSHQA